MFNNNVLNVYRYLSDEIHIQFVSSYKVITVIRALNRSITDTGQLFLSNENCLCDVLYSISYHLLNLLKKFLITSIITLFVYIIILLLLLGTCKLLYCAYVDNFYNKRVE